MIWTCAGGGSLPVLPDLPETETLGLLGTFVTIRASRCGHVLYMLQFKLKFSSLLTMALTLVGPWPGCHPDNICTVCHHWQGQPKSIRILHWHVWPKSYVDVKWWIRNGYILHSVGVASERVFYKQSYFIYFVGCTFEISCFGTN